MKTVSVTLDLPALGADRSTYLTALAKAKNDAAERGDADAALAIAHLIFLVVAGGPLPIHGVPED